MRKDFLLLEINEINAVFQKENFEIELFEIETVLDPINDLGTSDIKETLIPLKFIGPSGMNHQSVDYFFSIDVDEEIDEHDLCKYKGVDTTKGLFLQNAFDCRITEEEAAAEETDQYATRVETEDICD